jgi:membrane protease YdiL (CAAX protease family)
MTRAARIGLAASLACLALGAGTWLAHAGARAEEELRVPLEALGTSVTFVGLAVAGALALGGAPARDHLRLGPGRLRARVLVALVLGTLAVSFAADASLRASGVRRRGTLARFDEAVAEASGPSLAVAATTLGLAPAVGEELFFRGLLQRGLEARLGAVPAIALSALAFAAVHWDPLHAAAAFLLGLYLGAVARLAGSVRASMLCHAVNNLLAVGVGAVGFQGVPVAPATLLVVLAGAGAALAWARREARRQRDDAEGAQGGAGTNPSRAEGPAPGDN